MLSARLKRFLFAAILSAGLIWLAYQHHRQCLQKQADKQLLFAYLRGPFSEYMLGANTGLAALAKPGTETPQQMNEALRYYSLANQDLDILIQQAAPSEWKAVLQGLQNSHRQAAEGAREWLLAPGKSLSQRLAEEEAQRSLFIQALVSIKQKALNTLSLTFDEELEINAYLTSLKELQDRK